MLAVAELAESTKILLTKSSAEGYLPTPGKLKQLARLDHLMQKVAIPTRS